MKKYKSLLEAYSTSAKAIVSVSILSNVVLFTPAAFAYSEAPSSRTRQPYLFNNLKTEIISQATSLIDLANTFYRPSPQTRRASRSTRITGHRTASCASEGLPISLLAPRSIVSQTTLAHPEFVWYLPPIENNPPVIFQLLSVDRSGNLSKIYSQEMSYSVGYVTYQLPPDAPELTNNQEYEWQVIVDCNPSRPSKSIVQNRAIERVIPTTELTQALSTATTTEQKALAYGQAGLWYDAIAQVANATTPNTIALRTNLLQYLANSENEQESASQTEWRSAILELAESTQ